MTIFSASLLSATAPRRSFSCSSVTFCLSCPDLASIIRRFSISVALDSLTRRIRPSRSAASGRRICDRMVCRASAEKDVFSRRVWAALDAVYLLAVCDRNQYAQRDALQLRGEVLLGFLLITPTSTTGALLQLSKSSFPDLKPGLVFVLTSACSGQYPYLLKICVGHLGNDLT